MRLVTATIALVSVFTAVSYAVKAQTPSANQSTPPRSNQVYVKIILPVDPADHKPDRPVVESWIAKEIRKRGQSKFAAATDWVPLGPRGFGGYVWDGIHDDERWVCSVNGFIKERSKGRAEVVLHGWGPATFAESVSIVDEPGSREIQAVERLETDDGTPYVALLISPVAPPGSEWDEEMQGSEH
jgi:hypothetical protein